MKETELENEKLRLSIEKELIQQTEKSEIKNETSEFNLKNLIQLYSVLEKTKHSETQDRLFNMIVSEVCKFGNNSG